MECCDKVHGILHVRSWFPGIVRVWVALPFDKVLDSLMIFDLSSFQDCLNFVVVFFLTNDFRMGMKVTGAMGSNFFVCRQEIIYVV